VRVSLIVMALAVLSGVARADDREDARKEFAAGQAADRQKDWQTAIEHYLRANDLVPHPFAMFNIAADYERLNKLREAAKWYERYLEAATDQSDRDKVAKTLSELRGRPASLGVRTLPDGAQVTLDGAPAGKTPFSTTIKGGMHHVAVDLQGQHDERDVELEYGEPADVQFTLGGVAGTLYVYGTPAGAYVAIDNVTVGTVPATVQLPPGKHAVRVTAYGYTTYETEAVVQPNQVTQAGVTLPRSLGTIDAQTAPKYQYGYLVGASGGADVKSGDSLYLFAFGGRLNHYEAVVRIGRIAGATWGDLLFRWAALETVVTPELAAGYMFGGNQSLGYEAKGGLRWDVVKGDRFTLSLLGEIGLRWFSGTDSMGNAMSSVTYPLELTGEVMWR
jgi:tetratricopeptide (TPR) repeat protein